jgi:two-component system sensor histidine kinase UhpB
MRAPMDQRKERISEMIGSIGEAMSAVKRVATNLRPVALDALSFHEALAWYVEAFGRRSGITISLDVVHPFPEISGKAATALFRITQELLSNVSRHSGASHVAVHLAVEDDQLALAIGDNGKGIQPGRAEADDSFGIIGIRERCSIFGGIFMIVAVEGGGTLAEARLPLRRLQEE